MLYLCPDFPMHPILYLIFSLIESYPTENKTYKMKKKYTGLVTTRIAVECHPLMEGSMQKIEGKTNTSNWSEEHITVEEFGLTDITVSDISTTP